MRQQPEERSRSALPPLHESFIPQEHALHRPRHGARQRTARICAVVFLLLPLASLAFGARVTAFENRALVSFPSLGNGFGFFTGLGGWATDHLPFRQAGVRAEDWVSRNLFGELPPQGQSNTGSPLGNLPQANPSPADQAPGISQYATVLQGSDGWLYLGQDVSYKCQPVQDLDQVISGLRRLRAEVQSSGRRFVLIVAPDKSTMVPEHLPSDFVGKSCWQKATGAFWSRVDAQAGALDLRPALQAAAAHSGQALYDQIDTHWSFQGGVVMTYALADRLQPGITDGWVTLPTTLATWPADIPPLLGEQAQRHIGKYRLEPDGYTDRTNYEGSDFRTPLSLVDPSGTPPLPGQITTPTGMIADSFTQFASPFLAAAFTNLTIVHPETMAADPTGQATALLADKQVIVLELAEREVAGGATPLLRPSVIAAIGKVLAAHPIR